MHYMFLLVVLIQQQLLVQRVNGSWHNARNREDRNGSVKADTTIVTGTFCQWEKMNATCQPNEVIVMVTARYGRMQPGRCVTRSYGSVGCSTDVLAHMDSVCSGRQTCGFVVPDERLRELRPCPIDFAAYLEASYRCVAVVRPTVDASLGASSCTDTGGNHPRRSIEVLLGTDPTSPVRSTDAGISASTASAMHASPDTTKVVVDPVGLSGTVVGAGYIASPATDRSVAGSASCPWLLRAAPWQRINITLIDFTAGITAASTMSTATADSVGNTEAEAMRSPAYYHLSGQKTNVWSGSPSSTYDSASYNLDDSSSTGDGQFPVGVSEADYDESFDSKDVPSPHRRGHSQRQRGHVVDDSSSGTRANAGQKLAMSRRGEDLQSTLYGVETDNDDDVDYPTNGRHPGRGGKNGVELSRTAHPKMICQKYAIVRERMPRFQHHHQPDGNDAADVTAGPGYRHSHHHRNSGDDTVISRDTIVCGDTEREKVVYLSATNEVELELVQPFALPVGGGSSGVVATQLGDVNADDAMAAQLSSKNGIYFLLHYETVGCPTLPAPLNGWHARTGSDVMVVGCNATRERWYLHCDGRRWIGEWRNCSAHAPTVTDAEEISLADWSSPFGILVVSACGVAVGLFVGILLLSIMLLFVRRRKRRAFLDPVFISVPSSSAGGATITDSSMTSSAYHYGACIVHRDNVEASATGRHSSLPAAVFCLGSSPYSLRHQSHHHHHQQQQQPPRTTTMSASSTIAYGVVPCSLLSATPGVDGEAIEDDEEDSLQEQVDLDGRTTAAIAADFGIEHHHMPLQALQDDVQFYGGDDDRYYGEIAASTAATSDFRNIQHHQSRWIVPPAPDLTSTVPPQSSYGSPLMCVGYRGNVACQSCSSCRRRESVSEMLPPPPPPAASSATSSYGLIRLHQQRSAAAMTTDTGPVVGPVSTQTEGDMLDRHWNNSSTMSSNRYDAGRLGGSIVSTDSSDWRHYESTQVDLGLRS